ncbi:MAG: hypothetical protein M0C28_08440 [Candidatus Moduliflexus flocculans]|nr:hypothetical protein [Candidatus Moduliflexus flocculans]
MEVIINSTKETNFAAYIAVGVYHHYLITGDVEFSQNHVAVGVRAASNTRSTCRRLTAKSTGPETGTASWIRWRF